MLKYRQATPFATPFNRTIVELKRDFGVLVVIDLGTFNRTIVELKQQHLKLNRHLSYSFNRTIVELKLAIALS